MPIDKDIKNLVTLLNKHGVKSFGSCVDTNTMAHHEVGYGSTHCDICGSDDSELFVARGFINCIVTDIDKLTKLLDNWKWKHGSHTTPNVEISRGITGRGEHRWYACLTWMSIAKTKAECAQVHLDTITEIEKELTSWYLTL